MEQEKEDGTRFEDFSPDAVLMPKAQSQKLINSLNNFLD